jgi:hypothetical protein
MVKILKGSMVSRFFNIPVCWTDEHKSLEYTRKGGPGLLYDESNKKPLPAYTNEIKLQFPWLKDISMAYYIMMPDAHLPKHVDEYPSYRHVFGVAKSDITRVLVFLEDGERGHYLEMEGVIVTKWKAGDAVMWTDEEHAAGNFGILPRYTLQITGHV